MCGRFACNLSKTGVKKACIYKSAHGKNVAPDWLDVNTCGSYEPSYNVPPSSHTPVLSSSIHWEDMKCHGERVLVPMSWGLVPPWHRGDPKEFGLKTINCRVETILEKPTYKTPFLKGRRCVVLAEGFFEWKAEKGGKQPYYVYFPQSKGIDMATRNWEKVAESDPHFSPPRLLTMAGIFDTNILQSGDKFLSYTIITRNSLPEISWLHNRMPAVLDGEDLVKKWLDTEHVSAEEALKLLEHPIDLEWHAVSSAVGNVRHKDMDCVLPLKAPSIKTKSITDFFKPASGSSPPKKRKMDRK